MIFLLICLMFQLINFCTIMILIIHIKKLNHLYMLYFFFSLIFTILLVEIKKNGLTFCFVELDAWQEVNRKQLLLIWQVLQVLAKHKGSVVKVKTNTSCHLSFFLCVLLSEIFLSYIILINDLLLYYFKHYNFHIQNYFWN